MSDEILTQQAEPAVEDAAVSEEAAEENVEE